MHLLLTVNDHILRRERVNGEKPQIDNIFFFKSLCARVSVHDVGQPEPDVGLGRLRDGRRGVLEAVGHEPDHEGVGGRWKIIISWHFIIATKSTKEKS